VDELIYVIFAFILISLLLSIYFTSTHSFLEQLRWEHELYLDLARRYKGGWDWS